MKRVLFIAVCLLVGALNLSAQDLPAPKEMTSEQISLRNKIQSFLKEEGFVPTIDDQDNSVNWKKEGTAYWLFVEAGPDPFYIEIHESGFTSEGENRALLLEACNYANLNKRCGKACLGSQAVVFTSEFWCPSIEYFRKVFYNYISVLDDVKDATATYYNEHNK